MAANEALELKKAYSSATTAARTILESVEADPDWKPFARIAADLKLAVTAVADGMSPFARKFLSQDYKSLKKTMDDKELVKELQLFATVLRGPVQQLDTEGRRLIAMHAARAAA